MNEAEHKQVTQHIVNAIIPILQDEIKKTVIGKIDKIDAKLEKHIVEVQPILDLIRGSVIGRKLILGVTSVILAIGAIYTMFKHL